MIGLLYPKFRHVNIVLLISNFLRIFLKQYGNFKHNAFFSFIDSCNSASWSCPINLKLDRLISQTFGYNIESVTTLLLSIPESQNVHSLSINIFDIFDLLN